MIVSGQTIYVLGNFLGEDHFGAIKLSWEHHLGSKRMSGVAPLHSEEMSGGEPLRCDKIVKGVTIWVRVDCLGKHHFDARRLSG